MDRRTLLWRGLMLLSSALALGLGALGAVFGVSSAFPQRRNRPGWVALCRLDEIPAQKPLACSFSFQRLDGWYWQEVSRQVYVQRDARGEVQVLSRRCTHLGCPVRWREASGTFGCNCHGGVFAADGSVVSGPPPRALDVVPHRIAGPLVEVEEA